MRLMLTVPAVALEKLSAMAAVRRSSQLVRYDPGLGFWYWGEMRLSILLLPLFVIEILAFCITSLPMLFHDINEALVHGSIGQISAPPEAAVICSQILVVLSSSVLLPLYLIATMLFYYDVRIRREGFDLELMAQQAQTA
jgi:membrane-anchored glycerophosphoryl diester phosphodiesterase (GDPDase)